MIFLFVVLNGEIEYGFGVFIGVPELTTIQNLVNMLVFVYLNFGDIGWYFMVYFNGGAASGGSNDKLGEYVF